MRLRIITILLMVVTIAGGAVVGSGLFEEGSGGGWSHESGDAWSAENALRVLFDRGRPNLVVVVRTNGETVDAPAVAAAAADVESQLADFAVFETESYWSLGRPEFMRSDDETAGLIFGRIPGATADLADRADLLSRRLTWDRDVINVTLGGTVMTHLDIRNGSNAATVPVLVAGLLALLVAGAALRSARGGVILAVGAAIGASGSMIALSGLERLVEVPALAKVIALALALGFTTSTGYLLIARFTEERVAGARKQAAILATITTSGRVVAVIVAVTVAIGFTLVALPTSLLRATGLAVAVTAFVCGLAAVVVIGLLLSMFGLSAPPAIEDPMRPIRIERFTKLIDARPLVTIVLLAALLFPLAYMGVGVRTVEPGPETLTNVASSRRVAQVISAEFPSNDADAAFVLPGGLVETRRSDELVRDYVEAVSDVDAVARVDTARGTVVDGADVRVPPGYSARYESDEATFMLVPLEVNARSAAAESAVIEIGNIDAPFRINIGGATARQLDTVSAVSGRALFAYAVAAAFVLVLVAGLLRSVRAGVRATVMALMLAAVTGAVITYGFAEGRLAPILDFTSTGTVSVIAGPIAWTLAGIVASAAAVMGWAAVRERIDAGGGSMGVVRRGLHGTAVTHVIAILVLILPLAALMTAEWRTAQIPGAAAAATGLVAVTLGRFVLLPAFVAFRARTLWPVQADGEVRRVFPVTTASARWVAIEADLAEREREDSERIATETPVAESTDVETPVVTAGVAEDSSAAAPDEPAPEETAPEQTAPEETAPRVAAAEEAVPGSPPLAEPALDEPALDESVLEESAPEESPPEDAALEAVPAEMPPASVDEDVSVAASTGSDLGWAETVTVEALGSDDDESDPIDLHIREPAEEPEPTAASDDEAAVSVQDAEASVVDVDEGDAALVEEAAESTAPPVDEADTTVLQPVDDVEHSEELATPDRADVADVIEIEPDDAVPDAADAESVAEAADDEPATVPDLHVADEPVADEESAIDLLGEEVELPTVDVVSLTQSVIASLESESDFTTEIGSGFVANPSNNLSRVMEAILRDASSRGGDEVLVYGHASRDRYRWMVVDSGPRAETDPDRAHTLAEAQRFIRRVGGLVECRPQGDFTVFVVEIPMAS